MADRDALRIGDEAEFVHDAIDDDDGPPFAGLPRPLHLARLYDAQGGSYGHL